MIISYVVFENEDDAIRFHKEWAGNDQNNLTTYGRLVASYKLPSRFCDEITPFSHKREGWTLLEKRGWWVCPKCLRPTPPAAAVANFSESNYGHNIIDRVTSAELGTTL